MHKLAEILLPIAMNDCFSYKLDNDEEAQLGDFVRVNFRGKEYIGVIWGFSDNFVEGVKYKSILDFCYDAAGNKIPPIHEKMMLFVERQAKYNQALQGKVLDLLYSRKFFDTTQKNTRKLKPLFLHKSISFKEIILNDEQDNIYKKIIGKISRKEFSTSLIDGVTGSGKTELYLKICYEFLQQGKQIVILLPEILLANQVAKRVAEYFSIEPILWHSEVTASRKRKLFSDVLNYRRQSKQGQIIVGTRSALYLPTSDLGLVVVDEEHDTSYKQEDNCIYNGRDMAVLRASIEKIPVILASATPSVESYNNVIIGKYERYIISKRYNQMIMPEVTIINLRQDKLAVNMMLSQRAREEIEVSLSNNEQILLFLNRRGYSPYTLCRNCGFKFTAPDSSAYLTLHAADDGKEFLLRCHHTDYQIKLPEQCPKCKAEDSFYFGGAGVQRVAQEVRDFFPKAKSLILSSDVKDKDVQLGQINDNDVDIIIGTQIVAKGHNIKRLSKVIVLDADFSMDIEDFRAGELAFQQLSQVSGRAGRFDKAGKVFLQSYNVEHKIIKFLQNNDKEGFLQYELEQRRKANLPPFSRLVSVALSHKDDVKIRKLAFDAAKSLRISKEVEVLGPVKANLYRLAGEYRYRILLRCAKGYNIQAFLQHNLPQEKWRKYCKIKVDIDPCGFI